MILIHYGKEALKKDNFTGIIIRVIFINIGVTYDFDLAGALVVLLDQLTKNIVVAVMAEGQSIPIIPNIFHLTYILNPGAAFGMFAHNRTFFICVALLVLVIVWWFRKEILAEPLCVRAGTALFIGGAVGNLIDRAENGMVVDFFDFRIWLFLMWQILLFV